MKKVFALFLAFVFSLSAMGILVTVHKCMGNTSYIVFGVELNKKCKCKHKTQKSKSSCCSKKSFSVKTLDNGLSAGTKMVSIQKISLDNFLIPQLSFSQSPLYPTVQSSFFNHSPLIRCKQPVYILNSVFLI